MYAYSLTLYFNAAPYLHNAFVKSIDSIPFTTYMPYLKADPAYFPAITTVGIFVFDLEYPPPHEELERLHKHILKVYREYMPTVRLVLDPIPLDDCDKELQDLFDESSN